jgi:ATP-dependent helicase/nuclease subunit A
MMEALKLTPQSPSDPNKLQRQASDPRISAWVNASAGSGKTKVLTQRVIRLLLAGVRPERILCLTFTRAAAAEMAIRVSEQLSLWATCSDNDLSAYISDMQGEPPTDKQLTEARRLFARTLSCPGGMRICTIHAFCQEILHRFPIEANLPPHFTVIEETDAKALQEDVLRSLLRDLSAQSGIAAHDSLKLAIADLGEKGFREALLQVLRNFERIKPSVRGHADFNELKVALLVEFGLSSNDTEDSIRGAALRALPEAGIRQCAVWMTEDSKSFAEFGWQLLAWLNLPEQLRADNFETYNACFLTKDTTIRAKFASKALIKQHPEIDTLCRQEAERLLVIAQRLEAAHQTEVTAATLSVGSTFAGRYLERKRDQALLDYDDLIALTNELLNRDGIAPWVLYKLDGGLDHILVDEAQDTSRAQWNIVAQLADEFFAGRSAKENINRTLFVVGDEKQSIFSFQNADPEAYAEMRLFFERRITGAEKTFSEIPLSVSFRSAPAILRAVDTVFANEEARRGVQVTAVEHQAFNSDKIGRIEVWPLLQTDKKQTESVSWPIPYGYQTEQDPQAELASQIADKIKFWLNSGYTIPGTDHPVSPGEIMILLRRRGRFADLMVRALKLREVPVTGIDRMRLIEQLAVMDLLAIIQFMLLPEDDLNLATVLRGPLLNVSEDDLMTLAIDRPSTLWQSLHEKQQQPAYQAAYEYLAALLGRADFITPYSLLTQLLNTPCPGSRISGRRALWSRLGHDALDPIEELLNAAQNFSHRHTPSLQSFLHWLSINDDEIKRELDQGNAEVRIMTVHASKGLEAPIVFLPDTTMTPLPQHMPKLHWLHDELPLYLARKPDSGVACDLWQTAREKQLSEYRRLMYVALTRAASELYIAGWMPTKPHDFVGSWYDLISTALKPHHEPAQAEGKTPMPEIAYSDPILCAAPAETKSPTAQQKPTLRPAWLDSKAPLEATDSNVIIPSQLGAATAAAMPNDAFARGTIIHRLLQSLPNMETDRRTYAAARYLANPQHRLTTEQQTEIASEVFKLLDNLSYGSLFNGQSKAEVPVAGIIGGKKISGQIDRLCVMEDAVWIVDYKSNRPPPPHEDGIPDNYRQQLSAYKRLMQTIYPGKVIRCFLLWTYTPHLMEISERLLIP